MSKSGLTPYERLHQISAAAPVFLNVDNFLIARRIGGTEDGDPDDSGSVGYRLREVLSGHQLRWVCDMVGPVVTVGVRISVFEQQGYADTTIVVEWGGLDQSWCGTVEVDPRDNLPMPPICERLTGQLNFKPGEHRELSGDAAFEAIGMMAACALTEFPPPRSMEAEGDTRC